MRRAVGIDTDTQSPRSAPGMGALCEDGRSRGSPSPGPWGCTDQQRSEADRLDVFVVHPQARRSPATQPQPAAAGANLGTRGAVEGVT